ICAGRQACLSRPTRQFSWCDGGHSPDEGGGVAEAARSHARGVADAERGGPRRRGRRRSIGRRRRRRPGRRRPGGAGPDARHARALARALLLAHVRAVVPGPHRALRRRLSAGGRRATRRGRVLRVRPVGGPRRDAPADGRGRAAAQGRRARLRRRGGGRRRVPGGGGRVLRALRAAGARADDALHEPRLPLLPAPPPHGRLRRGRRLVRRRRVPPRRAARVPRRGRVARAAPRGRRRAPRAARRRLRLRVALEDAPGLGLRRLGPGHLPRLRGAGRAPRRALGGHGGDARPAALRRRRVGRAPARRVHGRRAPVPPADPRELRGLSGAELRVPRLHVLHDEPAHRLRVPRRLRLRRRPLRARRRAGRRRAAPRVARARGDGLLRGRAARRRGRAAGAAAPVPPAPLRAPPGARPAAHAPPPRRRLRHVRARLPLLVDDDAPRQGPGGPGRHVLPQVRLPGAERRRPGPAAARLPRAKPVPGRARRRPGQQKRAKFPTSKAPFSAVFYSFRL
ncbi:hypothetical protein AURANDRAFT_71700, partial [Aureococcus anophagefferens]